MLQMTDDITRLPQRQQQQQQLPSNGHDEDAKQTMTVSQQNSTSSSSSCSTQDVVRRKAKKTSQVRRAMRSRDAVCRLMSAFQSVVAMVDQQFIKMKTAVA